MAAVCNAACTFCPYPTLERKGTKMPDALLHRLVDELGTFEHAFHFSPFKVSEPLLDKRLWPVLQRVNDVAPLATTRIFTNAAALTWANAERLANVENVELWISFHEPDAEHYRREIGIDYDKVLANIDALHGSDFPHPVKVLTVGAARGQRFVAFAASRWPYFDRAVIKQDAWLGFTSPDVAEVPDTSCVRWFELSIMANGVVSLCCMDGKGEFPIGDVNTSTMLEVYNAPHWRDRRERMISRREVYPCSTCSY